LQRGGSECRQVEVPVRPLDSVLEKTIGWLTFVKCDVNYHELACLRGAAETIGRWKPALLFEVLPNPDRAGGAAKALFEFLTQFGYGAY